MGFFKVIHIFRRWCEGCGKRISAVAAEFKEQRNGEHSALSRLALYLDIAVHHLNKVVGYRHAKTCALLLVDTLVLGSFKRLEDAFQEFFRHSYAVVLENKLIAADVLVAHRLFGNVNGDSAAVVGVFDRVAYDIHEHLLYSQSVAYDCGVNYVVLVHDYLVILCLGIGLHHFKQAVKESIKVYLILDKLKLA